MTKTATPKPSASATHTSDTERTTDAPSESGDDNLAWLDEPVKDLREIVVSMRVTEAERDRIARAAAAAGSTPSAYARARVLSPGPDVDAWRAVYRLVLGVREAAERGEDPLETAQRTLAAFREIALTVLPANDSK